MREADEVCKLFNFHLTLSCKNLQEIMYSLSLFPHFGKGLE